MLTIIIKRKELNVYSASSIFFDTQDILFKAKRFTPFEQLFLIEKELESNAFVNYTPSQIAVLAKRVSYRVTHSELLESVFLHVCSQYSKSGPLYSFITSEFISFLNRSINTLTNHNIINNPFDDVNIFTSKMYTAFTKHSLSFYIHEIKNYVSSSDLPEQSDKQLLLDKKIKKLAKQLKKDRGNYVLKEQLDIVLHKKHNSRKEYQEITPNNFNNEFYPLFKQSLIKVVPALDIWKELKHNFVSFFDIICYNEENFFQNFINALSNLVGESRLFNQTQDYIYQIGAYIFLMHRLKTLHPHIDLLGILNSRKNYNIVYSDTVSDELTCVTITEEFIDYVYITVNFSAKTALKERNRLIAMLVQAEEFYFNKLLYTYILAIGQQEKQTPIDESTTE